MATTADYLNKLVSQKNALADNLVTKGIDATHDETLETLVPKVLEISGGGGMTNCNLAYSHIALGFIYNAKYNSGVDNCGYNLASDLEKDRLVIYKSYSGYNLTHSYAIDFTNVKKIIIHGATKTNASTLSAIAYCKITDEILSEMSDDWTVINQSLGTLLSDFSYEIDCSALLGEKYIYLAILHGTEINSNTSHLYLDSIEFIDG